MYRATFRLPKRSLLAASVATAGVVLHEPKDKLPIYPRPDPEILLVETPSPLEQQIGVARRRVLNTYSDAHAYVQGWVNRWIGVEHAVENRVKAIISPQESLTPGLLYVGVATLTGSIIARNRFILTRLLLPPILLVTSANHFLPKTTTNLSNYFGSLEETYFPVLSEKHEIAKAHTQMTWERIKESTAKGRQQLNEGAVTSVEKIQGATGLKIRETLGWTGGLARKLEEKAVETVEKKVEEVKPVKETKVTHAVEKKVEEVTPTKVVEAKAEPTVVETNPEEPVTRMV